MKTLFFLSALLCFSVQSRGQVYLTLNDLYNLSTFENVYDIQAVANRKGYYSDRLQGIYKDEYGNQLKFYKYDDQIYIDYSVAVTENSMETIKREIDNESYFCFSSAGKTSKIDFYRSPNGKFSFTLIKRPSMWELSVKEIRKGDPSPGYLFDKNKIKVNSYTDYCTVSVKKGDRVYLRAAGSVKLGDWAGWGSPEGIEGYTSYSVFQQFQHGSLLGRIGKGEWFLVGAFKSFVATTDGYLCLQVNDKEPSNNEGVFVVEYSINKEIGPYIK